MKRATIIYMVLNLLGILVFGWFVYRIEALAHAEGRQYRDGVDGVTFFTTAVPVFLVCVVGSCIWGAKVLIDVVKKRGFESLKALAAVVSGWTAVFLSLRFLRL